MAPDRSPVVVGVDGSTGSRMAVEVAAWEAVRRHRPLRLIHGYLQPLPFSAVGLVSWDDDVDAPRREAERLLTETMAELRTLHPELTVTASLVFGTPSAVLVAESLGAVALVVGCRGLGGFAGLLAGSVSTQVAAHAHCPVIVVRPGAPATAGRPVVVGVDGSEPSARAVEFALDEAAARDVPLVAVYAWSAPPAANLSATTRWQADPGEAADAATRMLCEALAGCQERYPDVTIGRRAVYSANPVQPLIDASREACLVVVGSRGRGGLAGMMLGSVSRALVHHAGCPVAIVHHQERPRQPLGPRDLRRAVTRGGSA